MLLRRFTLLLFIVNMAPCFGQGFAESDSKWVFNNEPPGILEINYEKDTVLQGKTFSEYLRTIIRLSDQDTFFFEIGSIYLHDDGGIVEYSRDGLYVDTLFNFTAGVGDQWKIFQDSTLTDSIDIEVLDVFTTTKNNIDLISQSVLYTRYVGNNERSFVDTVYEYLGAKYVYLDPFDVEEGSPEGGILRCFTNDLLGDVDPDNRFTLGVDLYSIYDYNCGETTSLDFITEENILCYPNPAHSVINIEHQFDSNALMQIIDINGRICLEQRIPEVTTIDISRLNTGVYYLLLDGSISSKFFKLN